MVIQLYLFNFNLSLDVLFGNLKFCNAKNARISFLDYTFPVIELESSAVLFYLSFFN